MRHVRHAFIGLTATLILAWCTNLATANRLSMSHGELQKATFTSIEFGAFGIAILRCPLTLEQSFHSATIVKVERALIGYVTGATLGRCIEGAATALRETLPWHITYDGFRGTLPRPTGIRQLLVGASLQVNGGLFGTCLLRTTTTNPFVFIAEGITYEARGNGIATRLVAESGAKIPCGSNQGEISGSGSVTESPGGAVNVLIRLI